MTIRPLLLGLCLWVSLPLSQLVAQSSGKIIYTYFVAYGVDDEELGDNPNLIGWVEKGWDSDTVKKELLFHGNKSLYRDYVEEKPKATNESDDSWWRYRNAQEKYDELYTDREKGETLHGFIFYEKKFLVSGVEHDRKWKVSNQSVMIDGYLCMQAICTDTFVNMSTDTISRVVAWFSPQIKASASPAELGGLPGVILKAKLTGKESTITIEAQKIVLEGITEEDVRKPSEGKKLSYERFLKIKDRKIKESKEDEAYWKDKYKNDNPVFGD